MDRPTEVAGYVAAQQCVGDEAWSLLFEHWLNATCGQTADCAIRDSLITFS
jgi:hypothetical protein